MKLQKINYTDTLIYKALEKLDMLVLIDRDEKTSVKEGERNVPVRAAKTITLHRLDLQIPEGTLFYITSVSLVYNRYGYPKNFELVFAFPDEEEAKNSGQMVYRYLPCKVDLNTYEILIFDELPLSELIEKVDGETAETMKSLYDTKCELKEREEAYRCKYEDVTSVYTIIWLGLFLLTFVFLGCAVIGQLVPFIFYAFGISCAGLIGISIAYAIKYFKKEYAKTDECKTLREKMSKLCKIIEEKETA